MTEREIEIVAVRQRVLLELEYFPQAEPQDLAKLLYQAAHGPVHLTSNPTALLTWLQEEMHLAETFHEGLLIQEITVRKPMFRLYLGPAKAKGFSTDLIHDLFLFSCQTKLLPLALSWEEMLLAAFHEAGFAADDYPNLLSCKEPFHHSKHYRDTYRPHYRLITMEAIQRFPGVKSILNLE